MFPTNCHLALYELLSFVCNETFGWGIHSRDLMDRAYNFSNPSKANGCFSDFMRNFQEEKYPASNFHVVSHDLYR